MATMQVAADPLVVEAALRAVQALVGQQAAPRAAAVLREVSARSLALSYRLDPAFYQRRLLLGVGVAAVAIWLLRR